MINKTLSVASAAIVALLAITASNTANAADACRASPGTEAPAGGHWRYRLEKGTGNKCWYLSGASEAASSPDAKRGAEASPSPAAPKPKSADMQPTVANARAELTSPESAQLNATVWPQLQNAPADANSSQDSTSNAQQQNAALAQRWPEPNSVATSDDEFAERMRVAANTTTQDTARDVAPVPPAPIAVPAVQQTNDENAFGPLRILLVSIIGVFAVAGILMRAATNYLAKRRKRKAYRRPIWDDLAIEADQMPPYIPRSAPTQPLQYTGPHHPRYAYRDDEDARKEIEHLLRRAAHREQN